MNSAYDAEKREGGSDMDACGKRLCFAMGAALLLVSLNVILVISGAADGVYENLAGVQTAGGSSTEAKRYAGNPGSRECNYADRVQHLSGGELPELAAVAEPGNKAC